MSGTLKKTKKLITMRLVMVHQKKFGGNVLIMDTNGKQVLSKDVWIIPNVLDVII